MVTLREIPAKVTDLKNGYSKVTFIIANELLESIAHNKVNYNGHVYRSIFVEKSLNRRK